MAISGEGLVGVRRATFVLVPSARWVPEALAGTPRPIAVPSVGAPDLVATPVLGEVAIGAADVDASGRVRHAFTLAPRWEGAQGGGELTLQERASYHVEARDADTGRRLASQPFDFIGRPPRCPGAFPSPPTLRWDSPAPCGGATTHLRGAGFTGAAAYVRLKGSYTRFGDGPAIERTVPVAADGSFDFAFVPDATRTSSDTPFFTDGGDYEAMAYDPGTHRVVIAPMPLCNPDLARAMAAPSIPLAGGIGGILLRRGSPPPGSEIDAAVFRSAADRQAFVTRHRLSADQAARFAGTDFSRWIALMVVSGPADGASFDEIVAVERTPTGLVVHAVRWRLPVPGIGDLAFDFLEIPRTDEAVTFAPIAEGAWGHRPYLGPTLDARGAVQVQEHP